MKYLYLLSFVALLYACRIVKTSDCSSYNVISIEHWGIHEIDKKEFVLYEYDTLNVFLKTIDIEEVRVYNKTATDPHYYGSMRIFLKDPLCPDRNYKLVISDSLQYNIQEIDMISFYQRAMLSSVYFKSIRSYKENQTKCSPKEPRTIHFDKNIAVPLH